MGRKFPFCGSDTPADGVVVGDLWIDTTSTPVVKVCTSVDPVVFTDYAAGKATATGSYTGNATNDRQITTGFKCSFVILRGVRTGTTVDNCHMIPNGAWYSALTECLNSGQLHATDGFTVDKTGGAADFFNVDTKTVYYWAQEE